MNVDIYRYLEEFCYDGVPLPKNTLWMVTEHLDEESIIFYSEEDILDYMDEINSICDVDEDDKSDSCDFITTLLPSIFKYDYLGEYLGEPNVIRKSHLVYSEDGFCSNYESFEAINSETGVLKILRYTDNGFLWQDYIRDDSLIEIYKTLSELEDSNGLSFDGGRSLILNRKKQ